MLTINPYINFNGNAEEAFNFYKSVFGGEFQEVVRFKDLQGPDFDVPAEEADKIMRIVLPIGSNVLLANDVPAFMGKVNENENRSKIAVNAESLEEAERIFTGLSIGGTVEMPMDKSPWGTHFAGFRDKFGIEWTVEFDPNTKKHNHIDLIEFPVKSGAQLKQTKDFFSAVFGWKYTDWGNEYSDTTDSGASSGVNADGGASMPLTVIYSSDLEKTKELVVKSGGKIIVDTYEFPGGRRFHFTEPNGNELAVWSE